MAKPVEIVHIEDTIKEVEENLFSNTSSKAIPTISNLLRSLLSLNELKLSTIL